jgi:hypothetical protein
MTRILKYQDFVSEKKDPCWSGYKQLGTKTKNGRKVPRCVKVNEGDSEFDRTEFYLKYYQNLSPSNFIVERRGNSIVINPPQETQAPLDSQWVNTEIPLIFR